MNVIILFLISFLGIFPCFSQDQTPDSLVYHSVNVITGEYCEAQNDLNSNTLFPLQIRRTYSSQDGVWLFNHPNVLSNNTDDTSDIKTSECSITYKFDENKRLILAQSIHLKTNKIFESINFTYPDPQSCHVETNDGRKIHYRCQESGLLEEFLSSDGCICHYGYCTHPKIPSKKIVSRREESDGRLLLIEYYDDPKDPYIGRVKCQKSISGNDHTPVVTHRFVYHGNSTEVLDALGHKTVYKYNSEIQRLTVIEQFIQKDGIDQLYRTERFYWNTSSEFPKLNARTYSDGNQESYLSYTFQYDEHDNLIKETMYGNLTGRNTASFQVQENGVPSNSNIEHYSTSYVYDQKATNRLISKIEDNGVTTHYIYHNDGRLNAKLIESAGQVKIRHIYFYNDNGQLTTTIIDDGDSKNPQDSSNVKEKHTTTLTLKECNPGFGKPEFIEESYFHFESGEKLAKKTVNHYSSKGDLIQQEEYTSDGSSKNVNTFSYDSKGRILSKIDKEGSTQYTYDLHGNQISCSQTSKDNKVTKIHSIYDLSNKLIQQESIPEETLDIATNTFHYDLMGNRISVVDTYGNMTKFSYDSLGRLIETISPPVLNENNTTIYPTEKKEYNVQDQVSSITDANEKTTATRYNARGKPIEIIHANGTKETFQYNLDGSLYQTTAINGVRTVYNRDFLARVIRAEAYTPSGQLEGTIISNYSAFRLQSIIDEENHTTSFTYDSLGRKSCVVKEMEDITKRIEFLYDGSGEICEQRDWFGSGPADYTSLLIERDETGKIFSKSLADSTGHIIRKENVAKEESADSHIQYTSTQNDRGQQVKQLQKTNKEGFLLILTMDALNRVESIVTNDNFGKMIHKQEMRYDALGNKVSETHKNFESTNPSETYRIVWEYGYENRLTSVTDAAGTTKQAKSIYYYDHNGQILQFIKPDGTALAYTYDEKGRVIYFQASDNSFFYHYTYGHGKDPIQIEDCLTGQVTIREYNEAHQLIKEILGNGLSMDFTYDMQNRPTNVKLPDNSEIGYLYNAPNLTTVNRYSSNKELLYSHAYTQYDLSGKVLKSELIGGLGAVNYTYGDEKQPISIQSSYWTQSISKDKVNRTIKMHLQDLAGSTDSQYNYDTQHKVTDESGDFSNTYTYDSLSNRISKNASTYKHNCRNQVVEENGNHYTYDHNGCLIQKKGKKETIKYKYDALNRLIQVQNSEGIIKYTYDAFNRRLSKEICSSSSKKVATTSTKLLYLYDGQKEIGAANESGELIELRVLGQGDGAEIGAAIAIELKNKVYAPLHDHRGNVSCLIDLNTKKAAECYRYSAFGEIQIFNASGEEISETQIGNSWQFSSKRHEDETGLINFGERFYNPEIGRWLTPDPLGFVDGPNVYAFVQNNPLEMLDLFGLFSWGDLWDGIVSGLNAVMSAVSSAVEYMRTLSYAKYIQPEVDRIALEIFGNRFLAMTGYYSDSPDVGCYGNGEFDDKVRITCINGILNTREDCMNALATLSEAHGGINIHYVLYPTEGWTRDMLKGGLAKLGFVSNHANLLAEMWKSMIKEMGGTEAGGTIIHYAHSIGGTNTAIARDLLTPEEQRMIQVITLGSATIVPNTGFKSVVNYVSCRDGVALSDPIGFIQGLYRADSNVIFLGSHYGIPFIDHMITMETYSRAIEMLGRQFVETYGPKK